MSEHTIDGLQSLIRLSQEQLAEDIAGAPLSDWTTHGQESGDVDPMGRPVGPIDQSSNKFWTRGASGFAEGQVVTREAMEAAMERAFRMCTEWPHDPPRFMWINGRMHKLARRWLRKPKPQMGGTGARAVKRRILARGVPR